MLVDVPTFTDEAVEAREKLIAELEWPEVNEVREAELLDRQARDAMAYYGVQIGNFEPGEGGTP